MSTQSSSAALSNMCLTKYTYVCGDTLTLLKSSKGEKQSKYFPWHTRFDVLLVQYCSDFYLILRQTVRAVKNKSDDPLF